MQITKLNKFSIHVSKVFTPLLDHTMAPPSECDAVVEYKMADDLVNSLYTGRRQLHTDNIHLHTDTL